MKDEAKIASALSALTTTIDGMKTNIERGDREFENFRDLVHQGHRDINIKLACMTQKMTFIRALGTVAKVMFAAAIAVTGLAIAYRQSGK